MLKKQVIALKWIWFRGILREVHKNVTDLRCIYLNRDLILRYQCRAKTKRKYWIRKTSNWTPLSFLAYFLHACYPNRIQPSLWNLENHSLRHEGHKHRPEGNSLHFAQAALTFLWIYRLKANIFGVKNKETKQKKTSKGDVSRNYHSGCGNSHILQRCHLAELHLSPPDDFLKYIHISDLRRDEATPVKPECHWIALKWSGVETCKTRSGHRKPVKHSS